MKTVLFTKIRLPLHLHVSLVTVVAVVCFWSTYPCITHTDDEVLAEGGR